MNWSRRTFLGTAIGAALSSKESRAFVPPIQTSCRVPGARSNLNLNFGEIYGEHRYINCVKAAQRVLTAQKDPIRGDWYMDLNVHQYPTETKYGIAFMVHVPGNDVPYVAKWRGSGSFFGISITTPTNSNRTYGGVTWNGGGANGAVVTNGRVTFSFGENCQSYIKISGTTINNFVICRADEEDLYDSGQVFRPHFIKLLQDFNPACLRFMNAQDVCGSQLCEWADRMPLDAITYQGTQWWPDHKVGQLAGTNTYTAPPYPGMPGTYTHGEFVHAHTENLNTSTTVTLDVGGRGAKPVLDEYGRLPAVGGVTGGTFLYDKYYDSWIFSYWGLKTGNPIESLVALCNTANIPGWFNIPFYASDDFMTQFANYLVANYQPSVVYFEYCNEIWNFAGGFPMTRRAAKWGDVTFPGIGSSGGANISGWYGYRMRQAAAIIRSVFAAAGQEAKVKIILASRGSAGDDPTGRELATIIENLRFQNSKFAELRGANAPIKHADLVSYALYYDAHTIRSVGQGDEWTIKSDLAGCKAAADNYHNGNTAAAFSWCQNDFLRAETTYAHISIPNGRFANWNALAAKYDRLVAHYEFNHEIDAPTVAWAITTSPFNAIANFTQNSADYAMEVNAKSVKADLPAGPVVIVANPGTATVYVRLGGADVAATTSDAAVAAGAWVAFTVGGNSHIAAIRAAPVATGTAYVSLLAGSDRLLNRATGRNYGFSSKNNPYLTAGKKSLSFPLLHGSSIVIVNPGTTPAYVKLGDEKVTATPRDTPIAANGGWLALATGGYSHIAAISASGSNDLLLLGGSGSIANGTTGVNDYGGPSGRINKMILRFLADASYQAVVERYLDSFYSLSQSAQSSIFAMCTTNPWLTFAKLNPMAANLGGDTTQAPYANWRAHEKYNNSKAC